jgi:hypothetical protein
VINCATIGPEATVDVAELVQARGASFLDAPFTGSKGAAEKSQLVYYVGGDEAVFQAARPVLEATSRAIVRCGRVGDAATLKIATNLISAATTQTLAEALALVQAAGIPAESLAAAIEHNACKSGVIELKLPKMISGDYGPHFSAKHMFKDVQLGIHLANLHQLELPVVTVTGGVLYGALCEGWGDLDFSSVYRIYGDAAKAREPQPALPAAGATAAPPENGAPVVVEAQWVEEKPPNAAEASEGSEASGKASEAEESKEPEKANAARASASAAPSLPIPAFGAQAGGILPPGVAADDSEIDLRQVFKRAVPGGVAVSDAPPAPAPEQPQTAKPAASDEKPAAAAAPTGEAPTGAKSEADERPPGLFTRLFGKREPSTRRG